MAQIIPFPTQPRKTPPEQAVLLEQTVLEAREKASMLVIQAAEILAALNDQDRRVAWLLEDSLDLLRPSAGRNAANFAGE